MTACDIYVDPRWYYRLQQKVVDAWINSPNCCAVGGKIDPILKTCWSRYVLFRNRHLVKKVLQIYVVGSKHVAVVWCYTLAVIWRYHFPFKGTYQNLCLSVVRASRLSKPIGAKSKHLHKSSKKSSSLISARIDMPADRKIGGMVYLSN